MKKFMLEIRRLNFELKEIRLTLERYLPRIIQIMVDSARDTVTNEVLRRNGFHVENPFAIKNECNSSLQKENIEKSRKKNKRCNFDVRNYH